MPFVSQAVAAARTKNRQKSRENEVKPENSPLQIRYYLCNICENVVLTQVTFKKHYNEIHQMPNMNPPIPKNLQEDEIISNCTIL